jgi:hypothetical protein
MILTGGAGFTEILVDNQLILQAFHTLPERSLRNGSMLSRRSDLQPVSNHLAVLTNICINSLWIRRCRNKEINIADD